MKVRQLLENEEFTFDDVLQNCKPFLEQAGKLSIDRQLWRGMDKIQVDKILRLKPRSERAPVNTDLAVHREWNRDFFHKFGWYARDGVFASGNAEDARQYSGMAPSYEGSRRHVRAHPFAIFPIGDFKFVWSPFVEDMYVDFSYFKDSDRDGKNADESIIDIAQDFFDGADWQTTNLSKAINSRNEIMINCDEYFVVPFEILTKHYAS